MSTTRPPNNHEPLSDKDLINCVKNGDEDAAHELFRRHWEFAYRCSNAMSRGFKGIDGEDLAQESLSHAFINIGSYDPDRAPFPAWLYGIIRNTLVNMIRARHSRRIKNKDAAQQKVVEVQTLTPQDWENIADGKDWRKIEETAWTVAQIASGKYEPPVENVRRTLHELIAEAIDKLPPRKRDMLLIKFLYYPEDTPSHELNKLEAAFETTRENIRKTNHRTMEWIKRYVLSKYEPDGQNKPQDNLTSDEPNDEVNNPDERTNTD